MSKDVKRDVSTETFSFLPRVQMRAVKHSVAAIQTGRKKIVEKARNARSRRLRAHPSRILENGGNYRC